MENPAFKRGKHVARLWLRLSKGIKVANSACMLWTLKRGLPAFLGRLPVPIAVFTLFTFMAVGGLFIGAAFLVGAIFIYMVSNLAVADANGSDVSEGQSGHQYRDGNDGFGMYSGPQNVTVTSARVDRDEDDE
ncbi:hypothetical protein [Mixta calida]|uniref:hypothetical protein n=1 Tax=Mixta calida TaxID=665913 RepID=UPI00119ED45A|nr:hypothetical protein [Mixta calida]